jgi:hypothetical protein
MPLLLALKDFLRLTYHTSRIRIFDNRVYNFDKPPSTSSVAPLKAAPESKKAPADPNSSMGVGLSGVGFWWGRTEHRGGIEV